MSITVKTQAQLDAALAKSGYAEIDIQSPAGVWLTISSNNEKYVRAYDSASVSASGSASVRAYGSASVSAYDSASVSAYDSASVSAYGSASVRAYGSASVSAYGSASVSASGSASVRAYDSASVSAYDSASVRAYDSASVRAYDSASVSAYDSASVRAYGSASVRASGSASVSAYDSASVRASGSASVRAYDSASVSASKYVAVHLHSAKVTHDGGVIIDVTKQDLSKTAQWADYHGVEKDGKNLIVYKAVNQDLKSERGFEYPIGEYVEAPDWKAGDFCGNGLHFCPSPHQALDYHASATRFLKVSVDPKFVTVIEGNFGGTPKLKAKGGTVLAEVDVHGRPVK